MLIDLKNLKYFENLGKVLKEILKTHYKQLLKDFG